MHENNPIKLERRLLVIFYILRISNVNFARRFIIPVPRIQLEVVSENLLPSAIFSSPFSLSSVCIFLRIHTYGLFVCLHGQKDIYH